MKALLIIDVQNDFCPGGALPVEKGDEVVPVLNDYIAYFREQNLPILATRDWHPEVTVHFQKYGGAWPVHCLQNSAGAAFHPDLALPDDTVIISCGVGREEQGYSAFEGVSGEGQSLLDYLRERRITELYVGGLATDYCVKHSVLDALRHGFKVHLLIDACRGIDVEPGDIDKAIREMTDNGATLATLATALA